jgi:lactocepin
VGIAKALGITNGAGNNLFNPKAEISREDMMVMTYEALMIKNVIIIEASAEALDSFTDKEEIANYAIKSVATLVQENLIMGSDNKINPKSNMTRAEAAVLIYRVYDRLY